MSVETKVRVARAFHAMKGIGISDDKVKPVLRSLLKLYDKDWKLIEEENYRVLADAIFEREEAEAAESSKKMAAIDIAGNSKEISNGEIEDCLEEAQSTEEPEQPLKRLRHKYRDGQTSTSNLSNTSMSRIPLIMPKDEPEELPETNMLNLHDSQGMVESPYPNSENKMVKSQTAMSQSIGTNGGEHFTPSKSLVINEGCDASPPTNVDTIQQNTLSQTEAEMISPSSRLGDGGKGPWETRSVPESSSDAVAVKGPNIELANVLQESIVSQDMVKSKDEPITDDIPCPKVSAAVIHPGALIGGTGRIDENDGLEESELQFVDKTDTADGNTFADKPTHIGKLAMISDSQGVKVCFGSLNESVNSQFDSEVPLQLSPPNNGVDDGPQMNLADDQHFQVDTDMSRQLHDVIDIAKGLEEVTITFVNEVNDECPPPFFYIPQNVVFQNACLNFCTACIGDKNCCSTCFGDCLSLLTPCSCAHKTGGEFAYTMDGLVKEELLIECISMNRDPKKNCQIFCKECVLERSKNEDVIEPCKGHLVRKFIKECWSKCGCNKQCGNRVVQRGITRNLQVFMTPEGKGWGLRTLEDLPKGAFVCEYVGEVLTNSERYDRVSHRSRGVKHSYPVLLDAVWGAEEVLKDEEALCLDATYYGNVARFINHRCYDSNIMEIPVEVETPDHHYYHLAFFATRNVKAMEELTWDYGIDFDDHDHPIKAFDCLCGSKFCRNIKSFSRSRSSRR